MNSRRKIAEQEIIATGEAILPGGGLKEYYEQRFKEMSDEEFDLLMKDFLEGKRHIAIIVPNGGKVKLSTKRNLAYAEKIGHNFFTRLTLTDAGVGITYKTPVPYMCIHLTLRRQAQMMEKKRSIPEKITNIDQLTNQPTGASKGAKVSFTELQFMRAQGLNYTAEEFMAIRGGNMQAFNAMRRGLIEAGEVDINQIKKAGGVVKSTQTLHVLLRSQHLENNAIQR